MDHLLNIKPFPSPPPSYDLKLKAQHQTSTKTVLKIKHLLHGYILKHVGRLAGALGGAKSVLLDLLSKKTGLIARHSIKLRKKIKRKGKKPCGSGSSSSSISMHLNLLPDAMPSSESAVMEPFGAGLAYYDSSWNTVIPAEQLVPISGYLEWTEEDHMEDDDEKEEEEEDGCNEIDRLAEKFIARCHERFMLEKQESYRRFQEMLARSL